MKFIVDAQLPKALANFLRSRGFDAIHTSEMPRENETKDREINQISLAEQRIVISKDEDFYDSFQAKQEPYKLLHLTTGNIRNRELIDLFDRNLLIIIDALNSCSVVELSRTKVISIF